jgi:hypothetical protein
MHIAYLFSIPFCLEFAYQAQGDHLTAVRIYPYPLSRHEKISTYCPSLQTFSVITMESDVFLQVRWKSQGNYTCYGGKG